MKRYTVIAAIMAALVASGTAQARMSTPGTARFTPRAFHQQPASAASGTQNGAPASVSQNGTPLPTQNAPASPSGSVSQNWCNAAGPVTQNCTPISQNG